MNDRAGFVAELVTVGPLPDGPEQLGWASDHSGAGPHLILMRDEDDGICVVSGDEDHYVTHYGGVTGVDVSATTTRLHLTAEAAAALDLPPVVVITYAAGVLDVESARHQLDRLLA